jgi:hypothetical protein
MKQGDDNGIAINKILGRNEVKRARTIYYQG